MYVVCVFRSRSARKEQSLISDLFKAFDRIASSQKTIYFSKVLFSFMRAQHIFSYHII